MIALEVGHVARLKHRRAAGGDIHGRDADPGYSVAQDGFLAQHGAEFGVQAFASVERVDEHGSHLGYPGVPAPEERVRFGPVKVEELLGWSLRREAKREDAAGRGPADQVEIACERGAETDLELGEERSCARPTNAPAIQREDSKRTPIRIGASDGLEARCAQAVRRAVALRWSGGRQVVHVFDGTCLTERSTTDGRLSPLL